MTIFSVTLVALALAGCPSDMPDPIDAPAVDGGDGDHNADGGAVDPDDPDPSDPNDPEPNDPDPNDPEPNDPDPNDPEPSTARFFMPTDGPANTRAPQLELDADGNLHALYPAYAGGDAYYALCADGCSDPDAMSVVRLPTEGSVVHASLALTKSGAPRVLLATALELVFAQCDEDCADPESWQSAVILDHGGDREISAHALALDKDDKPRFVMNTYVALLGIGQKTPQTFYAQCESDCTSASAWRIDVMQEQVWQASSLRFDESNRAHLATVAVEIGSGGPVSRMAAYLYCDSGCEAAEGWSGIGLMPAYEDYAEGMAPTVALALDAHGAPRVAVMGESDTGKKNLAYFECDSGCDENNWRLALISENDALGSGLDLELADGTHPRIAFTLADSIGVYACSATDCFEQDGVWDLLEVEKAADIPADGLILWPNCTISAWMLSDPALVLDERGDLLAGYQASDVSGGVTTVDPTKPACLAGADMTLTRMALVH